MGEDTATRLLSEVLKITASVAAISPALDRLEAITANINDRMNSLVDTKEKHELRITQLEHCMAKLDTDRQTHHTWRNRLGGAWIGMGLLITSVGAVVAALLQWYK